MRRYALTKDPGAGMIFSYTNNWDSNKIQGCVCDPGYSGVTCSDRTIESSRLKPP